MNSSLILLDPNRLRTAAFAAFLVPWAHQSGNSLIVVNDTDELAELPFHTTAACLYSIGGLSLCDEGVVRTISRLRELFPDSPVVVFSDNPDGREISTAIHLELRGFIPTTMPSHVALAALQFILSGGTYHPHSLADTIPAPARSRALGTIRHIDERRACAGEMSAPSSFASFNQHDPSILFGARSSARQTARYPEQEPLTKKRHVEVLQFLAQGETNKEIARHLNLTEATIKVYIRELMQHFGARNRMQVILKASALFEAEAFAEPPSYAGSTSSQS